MKHLLALLVSLSLALSGCMRSLAPSHPWGHAGLPNRNAGYAWLAKLPPKKAAQEISALLQKLAGRGGFALTPAQFDRPFGAAAATTATSRTSAALTGSRFPSRITRPRRSRMW